jgi:hypothetical protein
MLDGGEIGTEFLELQELEGAQGGRACRDGQPAAKVWI